MKKNTYGFTIVELLVVIVVIAILAAISIVAYNGIQARAHRTAVQADLANNAKKLEEYRILNERYPATRAEFRSAGLKFTLNSYRHTVYCARNTGNDPQWAIVTRIEPSGARYYQAAGHGFGPSTAQFATAPEVCGSAGIDTPDIGHWLTSSGNWSDWVD